MKILVLNAGSSSLKYSLFSDRALTQLSHGNIPINANIDEESESLTDVFQHAFQEIEQHLKQSGHITSLQTLDIIAHRVVHGGEQFHGPVKIDSEVMQSIAELAQLAPLHNPVNLAPISYIHQHFPAMNQVAVFDTAFHQTLPEKAFRYALPDKLYQQAHIRRYGFHGSSHQYILNRYANLMDKRPQDCSLISLHLGNGASICAIEHGKSIDTSMGFTPLEGLVMGTRCGDIDPAIPIYLIKQFGYSPEQVDDLLNHHSGLLGLCGSYDMANIIEQAATGDLKANLALDIFCYRINKVVGGYLAIMDEVQALVFTAGIGEHSAAVRERIINGFSNRLNLKLNRPANRNALSGQTGNEHNATKISSKHSSLEIWVMNTDEEKQIAQHCLNLFLE